MINFFRTIRKKLLSEGKTTKYFKYAIGEIVLVVIGILIALQINNWNENNKTNRLEIKILKELYNNLTLDLDEIQLDIRYMDSINNGCSFIKHYLETNNNSNYEFSKNLALLRVTSHFDPNKGGYNLLQSKGLDVVSNDILRNTISLLYERSYPYYRRYEEERVRFHAIHSEPMLLKYFKMDYDSVVKHGGNFKVSIHDYKILQQDSAFIKLLHAIAFENSTMQNRGNRTAMEIENLMELLDKEIKQKTNND